VDDDDILQIQVPLPPRPPGPPTPPPPLPPLPPALPTRPPGVPEVVPAALPTPADQAGRTSLARIPESTWPELLGDAPPLTLTVPGPGGPFVIPRPRGFKIDDNDSPAPQDRTYFTFNAFNNVYHSINQRYNSDVQNISVQRETFGVEKAFYDKLISVELRMPMNTVTVQSSLPELAGTHTSVGDLSFITKFVLWRDEGTFSGPSSEFGEALADLLEMTPDPASRTLVSAGLAVTAPTGPDSLFHDPRLNSFHTTLLTPYLGYIWKRWKWYVQGFISLDIPTDSNDVTLLLNDLSIRYFLYEASSNTQVITAIVPVLEGHVSTPLNHRGILHSGDPAGTPDVLDVTVGVDVRFFDWAKAVFGFVTPLTGPKLQDYEVLSQFKMLF
jgi:hypothetical protein